MTRRLSMLATAMVAAFALSGCNLGIAGGSSQADSSNGSGTGGTGGSTTAYSIGGSISGLTQSGLSLTVASGNIATVAAGATTFTLPKPVASGTSYIVSVKSQPTGQSCKVANASGTIASAAVTNVQVTCTLNDYPIGGTITGLNANGLVLVNGTATVSLPAGASAFVFPTKFQFGSTYAVAVQTQPTGLTCQVVNASGTVAAAAVTNLLVVCGQWTWIGGANQTGGAANYGSLGSPASANIPGARSGAVSWRDQSGNLWLFGGSGAGGLLNDLWEYTPGSGEWTWVSGSSTPNAAGVYGTQGSPGVNNVPGARQAATAWVDTSGHLWLFGGQGYDGSSASGALNDLWEYDISNNTWTWVSGASTAWPAGSTPPTGQPGGRSGAVAWVDGSDNFWLFGGSTALASGPPGFTNDLWEYVPGTQTWTWVSGSQTTGASTGVYGTQGTAAVGNTPGSRAQGVAAIDAQGDLWLFGGTGFGAVGGSGLLNDLWEFNPTTQQWTWVGGWNSVNAPGVYGTRSTTAVNDPGARYGATAVADASGDLWLFGGVGFDVNGKQGPLNDLWEYDTGTAQWIWMGGAQTTGAAGVYGTLGAGAVGDGPGERSAAMSWMDASGNLWLFGGDGLAASGGVGLLNDLWQFVP